MIRRFSVLIVLFLSVTSAQLLHGWSFFSSSEEEKTPTQIPTIPIPLAPPPVRFTIMIDPLGDMRHPGRTLDGTDEETVTLDIAQHLKKAIEEHIIGIRVIIARDETESPEHLSIATRANTMGVDLYVTLSCYKQQERGMQLSFFNLLYNPETDFWQQKEPGLQLLPIDQSYKTALPKTTKIVRSFFEACSHEAVQVVKEKKVQISCKAPLGIPFKPLIGITVPAFALEIGMKNPQSWRLLIPTFEKAFEKIIEQQLNPSAPETSSPTANEITTSTTPAARQSVPEAAENKTDTPASVSEKPKTNEVSAPPAAA